MEKLKILNEDFFDNNDIDVNDEIEDVENDNTEYTHHFHIYFNTPIMCGQHYEKYVEQYTPRIGSAIKITNRIFSAHSAIIDYSSIELSRDRIQICDKEVEMGEYSIKYSSSIHSGKYRHGLAFAPDKIIISIKAVCNFRTVGQIERFFNLFFNKIAESQMWIGVGTIVIEKLNTDESKSKNSISVFDAIDWNRKDWGQRRDDIAQMLDVLAKPGVYGQFLHKYKNDDSDIIIRNKRNAEIYLCKKGNVYTNSVKVQNIYFYETGRGTEAAHCEYDVFDGKHKPVFYSIINDLNDNNVADMCKKAIHQVTSRKSVFDMYILKFDTYTIGGKCHIGIYYIFQDTFTYKDKEYILTFYSESTDYTDVKGSAYCLNMMKSVGYSEEDALEERNIGVFYRDDMKNKIIDKAEEIRLAE